MKTQIQYLEGLVEDMGTGFVTYGEREFEELDYESMDQWDREQRDFTQRLLKWRQLRMMRKPDADEKFLELTHSLHAQAFFYFNRGWLVSKAPDRRFDKIEQDIKSLKNDMKRLLLNSMNNSADQAKPESNDSDEPELGNALPPKRQDFQGVF